MKIGVYGGRFNPCHLMHKKLVEDLLNNNYFDRIIIVPTGNFYRNNNLLKGEERIKMLEIMFNDNPRVIISDYQFRNNLISTFRSLDYLQNLYKGDKLYFILGGDNLCQFDTWNKYEYILNNYNLCVIKRKGFDIKDDVDRFSKYNGDLICLDLNLDETDSIKIRNSIVDGSDYAVRYLDPKVYSYIKEKGFYLPNYQDDVVVDNMTDEEFLKKYDSSSYEKVSITTDITLFSVSDLAKSNYRQIDKKAFSILLVKRNTHPFLGMWCLPGGFLSLDETLIDCARRVLFSETNLNNIYLEQLYTFSGIDRDVRDRVISCSYLGLVDKNQINDKLRDNAKFFVIRLDEDKDTITIFFDSDDDSFSCKLKKQIDEFGSMTYKELENNYLAFDNLLVIITSIKRLQNKLKYTDIVFHMMPKRFTFKELQLVFEAILGQKLLDPVFRREMSSKLVKTDEIKSDGGHRPAVLYEYKGE